MSKKSKKSGTMHKCKGAEPSCQTSNESILGAKVISKSDLDERDNKADPTRKSPGPKKSKARGSSGSTMKTSSTPEVTPIAMTNSTAKRK